MISIICPTYNEEKFIGECIDSILKQDFPRKNMELFIVDGRSTDKTREVVAKYTTQNPFIHLLDNPYKIQTSALNIGIKEAKGDVIMRIDAHSDYPQNYISTLVEKLYELHADNVGGIWNTRPQRNNPKPIAIAEASSHPFGVGNAIYKIGCHKIMQVDTVPFGCYRRDVFNRIGYFDEDMIRNEDDEFNARLINNGGKIFVIPDLQINYYARDTFSKMCEMYYQYGLFKPLANKKTGKPATIRQFFPALFVAGLICGLVLSFFSKIILILYVLVLLLHLLLGIFIGVKNAFKYRKPILIFYLPVTFFIIHCSYGWGYWIGIFKILFKQKFSAKITR